MARTSAFRRTSADILFEMVVYGFTAIAFAVTAYPFLYVVSMSISAPGAVLRNEVLFWPVGFDLTAYKIVFRETGIWQSYYNTLWYTVVGTFFSLIFTVLAAYPLSKKRFFARNFFTFVFVLTMFFGGGMIPSFILVVKLGLYDTRWAMVLPSLLWTYNVVICRTFFQGLPEDLFESARIEGVGEWTDPVVPRASALRPHHRRPGAVLRDRELEQLTSPALLYLPKAKLQPIQLYLQRVLIQASPETMMNSFQNGDVMVGRERLAFVQVKYAVMVVAIFPIAVMYPFLQKYFVKGVMIGALKG